MSGINCQLIVCISVLFKNIMSRKSRIGGLRVYSYMETLDKPRASLLAYMRAVPWMAILLNSKLEDIQNIVDNVQCCMFQCTVIANRT